jgi:hypothetical protein
MGVVPCILEITRVGGTYRRPLNNRILGAATTRNIPTVSTTTPF